MTANERKVSILEYFPGNFRVPKLTLANIAVGKNLKPGAVGRRLR